MVSGRSVMYCRSEVLIPGALALLGIVVAVVMYWTMIHGRRLHVPEALRETILSWVRSVFD